MRLPLRGHRGVLLLFAILWGAVDGFIPKPVRVTGQLAAGGAAGGVISSETPNRPNRVIALSSAVLDEPSDVENTEIIDVEAEEYSTPRRTDMSSIPSPSASKDQLMELISGGLFTNSARKRAQVNEWLLRLEAMNPTEHPSFSPLLNGAWELLYTGGISPGMLGLQLVGVLANAANGAIELGDTELTITRTQPRVEVTTTVSVFGRKQTFKIRTKLDPESDIRIKETYVEAQTGALRLPFPEQALFERPLFISYLDDDMLVVRDSFGCPDILVRKPKSFATAYAGVPSSHDDDAAPGAG